MSKEKAMTPPNMPQGEDEPTQPVSPLEKLCQELTTLLDEAYEQQPPAFVLGEREERESLLDWGKRLLPEHFSKPPSKLHCWLAGQLDRTLYRPRKINLIGPRGAAKSTIGTLAFVLRTALEATEPYIWIVSDTKNQAQLHLENIKSELAENRRLAKAYPHAVRRGGRWQAAGIQLSNGVVLEAYGAGQRLRGRRRRANRPTLIVCDDLQNDGHIASARQRELSHAWFHGALLKAGSQLTTVVNLATALHRDALAMQLHTTPGWQSERFRSIESWPTDMRLWQEWETLYCDVSNPNRQAEAVAFYNKHQAAMHAGAEVLWPEEEDLHALMQMRIESGVTAFEREKQGSPIDPDRCEWPDEYFGDDLWFNDWPSGLQLRTMALDPSKGGDSRHGDYSAFVMIGIDQQGVIHVEADLARRPTPQMVSDGVEHCLRFRPDVFGVETNQWQQLLAAEFTAAFANRGLLGVTPCEINNYTNKAMRIRRLGPYLSQRRLRFKANSPATKLLIDQLRDFPVGAHDDGPDALEMALRLAEEVWQGRRASDGLGDRILVGRE